MIEILLETPKDSKDIELLLDLTSGRGRGNLPSYKFRSPDHRIKRFCRVLKESSSGIIGSIRYWPIHIVSNTDKDMYWPALLLGPLAIHPAYQGEGLGRLLITTTLSQVLESQWDKVLLVGDLAYYQRFGFTNTVTRGITFPCLQNPERFLGLEYVPRNLANICGTLHATTVHYE
jgi:predicted N-acetyltransferase YhbS